MQKFILLLFIMVGLFLGIPTFAQDTNRADTNRAPSSVTSTNIVRQPSDPELQAAAQRVWHKLIVVGILALVGAVVVAGFALYGAYRKFGVTGVVVVGIIIAFGVLALSGLLLTF